MNSHPIHFHEGATNSYIGVDFFTPDNLEIHANQDLELIPDDNLIISSSTSAKTISYNDFDLRGELTASGNISSSGTIIASNLSGTNTGDQDLSSYSTIVQLNASSSTLQTNIDAKSPIANPSFTGNITASGNISSSGTIKSNQYEIEEKSLAALESDTELTLGYGMGGGKINLGRTNATPSIFTNGHITASGNISASGNIYATDLFIGGTQFTDVNINANHFGIGHLGAGSLSLKNISSSGDISASGNIYATDLFIGGTQFTDVNINANHFGIGHLGAGSLSLKNISSSGDISASGTVTANSIVGTVGTATQGTIDHDSLANFVANEHIDHSGVSITAGAGLTGGGTIAATRTLSINSASIAPFFFIFCK